MANYEAGSNPSVIMPQKPPIFSRKLVVLGIITISLIIAGILLVKFGIYNSLSQKLESIISPKGPILEKQSQMIQFNQSIDEVTAKDKAKEELERQDMILKESKSAGVIVSQEEVEAEAQRLISQTSQEDILKTLQSYNWTEEDWKRQIYFTLLEEKLKQTSLSWRDHRMLTVRWDDHSKLQLPSEDEAFVQAKTILEDARKRLEQKEDFEKVFLSLSEDKKVNKYFVVQAIIKPQRIWSDTKIASDELKQFILSTPPNTLSQVKRLHGFAVIIETFDGVNGNYESLEKLFKKQSFVLPSLVKTAYASHENSDTCLAKGTQQYCAAGDYCYYEGVIAGKVKDPAGNSISGATVFAQYPGTKATGCLCTGTSSSATSDGNGGYSIHGLCCFNNPFKVTAAKIGYTCNDYDVSISNGTTIFQDITCIPDIPLTSDCDKTPDCDACNASVAGCGTTSGSERNCFYTEYSGGGSCDPFAIADRACTRNNGSCTLGYVCSSNTCVADGSPVCTVSASVTAQVSSSCPAGQTGGNAYANITTQNISSFDKSVWILNGYTLGDPSPLNATSRSMSCVGYGYGLSLATKVQKPSGTNLAECSTSFDNPAPNGTPPPGGTGGTPGGGNLPAFDAYANPGCNNDGATAHVNLNWDSVSGANYYEVWRRISPQESTFYCIKGRATYNADGTGSTVCDIDEKIYSTSYIDQFLPIYNGSDTNQTLYLVKACVADRSCFSSKDYSQTYVYPSINLTQHCIPDMVTFNISASPASIQTGQSITLSGTVSNQGLGAKARASVTRLFINNVAVYGDSYSTYSTMDYDDNRSVTWTLSPPPNTVIGTNSFKICADANNNVIETNESNNCASGSFTVTAPPPPTVDLKVTHSPLRSGETPSNGPITAYTTEKGLLTWTSTGAASCSAYSAQDSGWSGSKPTGNSSGNLTSTLTTSASPYRYTLTCTNAGGNGSDYVDIYVTDPNPSPFTLYDLTTTCNADGSLKIGISWSDSTYATTYEVWRYTSTGGWSLRTNVLDTSGITTFAYDDLFFASAGSIYIYNVRAKNNNPGSTINSTPEQKSLIAPACAIPSPWIQTSGGDVHSNTKIDTPGGP